MKTRLGGVFGAACVWPALLRPGGPRQASGEQDRIVLHGFPCAAKHIKNHEGVVIPDRTATLQSLGWQPGRQRLSESVVLVRPALRWAVRTRTAVAATGGFIQARSRAAGTRREDAIIAAKGFVSNKPARRASGAARDLLAPQGRLRAGGRQFPAARRNGAPCAPRRRQQQPIEKYPRSVNQSRPVP